MNASAALGDSDDAVTAGPITAATDRLIATAAGFDNADLARPSLCAGWSRAHVLAHVARNADALANLLTWARTGRETPMYASKQQREADIEAGARHGAAEIVDDVRASAGRFVKAIMDMPDDGWERQVRPGAAAAAEPIPARRALWLRLREVEIHHVDLDAGYRPGDWPSAFVRRALPEVIRQFSRRDDVPPVVIEPDGGPAERLGRGNQNPPPQVSGPGADVLAWLLGRSGGAGLRVEPAGAPPVMPAWS